MVQIDKQEREGALKKVINFLKKKGYSNLKPIVKDMKRRDRSVMRTEI